jgi:predicted phage tail protein
MSNPQAPSDAELSGGMCFAAGTVVHTPRGLKPIEGLKAGDEVCCFDWDGSEQVSRISSTSFHESAQVYKYQFWGGSFIATPNHWVLTEGNAFKEIGDLTTDEVLYDRRGLIRPFELSHKLNSCSVYNLRVEKHHSFFAGDAGIRVHNGGGGKGGGSSPQEADDTGRSTSRAYVLEAVSEGAIEGLVGGRKGILLDKTPVQNPDNSLNFKGFKYKFRRGLANQSIVAGDGEEIANETSVNVEVKESVGATTRTIVNNELDLLRIRIAVTLIKYEEDGDVNGTDMEYKIETKQGAAAWATRYQKNLEGKFSSPVELEYSFNVNNQGSTVDTFQIRITKISDDSTSQKKIQRLQWVSFTEVITNKLNYPYTAYAALQFLPEQFSSIPQRQYKIGGRLVRIPSNATVDADRGLSFSGNWDGTFYTPARACADPAWQLYDILVNKRYGLGRYIDESLIDKASLYRCSQHNNEVLSTGLGYSDRRYSCNIQLQSTEKAWEVINAFCSAFHAKPYWSGGVVQFWQDRATTPIRQFTQADVSGRFVYSRTAIRARFTLVRVTWSDPEDYYQRAIETVEDIEGINRYGIRETEIAAFGCTSRALAIRIGRWVLYSSRYERRSVAFTARSIAAYCRPGEVIQIADSEYAGTRYGGLIVSSTSTSVVIDSPISFFAGMNLIVTLPTGALETRIVANSGTGSGIAITQAFSEVPLPEATWMITSEQVQPQTFRVLSVIPKPQDPTQVEINAIEYNEAKYAAIENDIEVEPRPTRFTLPTVVSPPTSVVSTWSGATVNNSISYTLIGSWSLGASAELIRAVLVEYSRDGITWQDTRTVIKGDFSTRFENVGQGVFYVRVSSVDINGRASAWATSAPLKVGLITYKAVFNTADTSFFALDF